MKQVKIYRLEDFKETEWSENQLEEAYVIVGEPCDRLLGLQESGYLVLAELRKLQGLSEEEMAEALSKEDAVLCYRNVCIDASQLENAYFQRIWYQFRGEAVIIGETEHLLIRESIVEDAEAFFKLYQDEACQKYLEKPAVSEQSIEGYRKYIEEYRKAQYAFYEYGMWTVVEKSSGCVAGRMGLESVCIRTELSETGTCQEVVSLGYALRPEFRGRGYATEACREILRYCTECGYAEKVYIRISAENKASQRVYEKLDSLVCITSEVPWNSRI